MKAIPKFDANKSNNIGEFKRAGSHMNFPMSICICLPSVYNTVNPGPKDSTDC